MTKIKVYKLAKKLNATIQERGSGYDGWDIMVDAPDGYVWSCGGDIHCLVANNQAWPEGGKQELWQDLYERMIHGIELCELDDCDMCHARLAIAKAEGK